MTLCQNCGASVETVVFTDGHFAWLRCAACGKMLQVRTQTANGSVECGGVKREVVECAGEIDAGEE
jgi:uncharacterized Zn finger protein